MPAPAPRRVELLAPAGGPEAFIAAVNNGADAVYLGLGQLNARRGAANFTLETFAEHARFAHLNGARVYLTANVLVLPDELGPALTMIDEAWVAGADAVIVQDLGLLSALRQAMPEVRIHASTQIDAMNPDAVSALADAGVSRVTLARELSFDAIAACAATGVEVESFVHGAICYCYSGQCLMSSLIGRRSANRGMCAQPCRLPYELLDAEGRVREVPGRYLLSPKDLAGIEHLPRLIGAGVRALKIEGRMKSPEYVAVVTGVYRAALDRALADAEGFRVTDAEWAMLEEAFSRGFTDAYLTGERREALMSYTRPNNRGVFIGRIASVGDGRARIDLERPIDAADTLEVRTGGGRFAQQAGPLRIDGVEAPAAPAGARVEIPLAGAAASGDRVFRVANAALLEAARRTFAAGVSPTRGGTPVDLSVTVRVGRPLRIAASLGETRVEAVGADVALARTKPITLDEIIEHVGRLGGSGYRAGSWEVDLDADAGLGYSALHALRREALARLDARRLEPWAGRTPARPRVPARAARRSSDGHRTPGVVATAFDLATARACVEAGADRVLLRVFGAADPVGPGELPAGVEPLLPRVVWPGESTALDAWSTAGLVTAGNLGTLARLAAAGVRCHADWPLNVLNAHAAAALAAMGASAVWASPESSGRQLAECCAGSPVPVGFAVWGRQELMVAEQCVLQAAGECGRRCAACARRRGWWHLRDRKGYAFPVTTDASGRSHIMNAVTLDLTRALDEVVAAGVAEVRLDFTDEPPARAAEVVRAVRSAVVTVANGGRPPAEPLAAQATSGHFYRGVL